MLIFAFTPQTQTVTALDATHFSSSLGQGAELARMASYILRWFAHPRTITHPCTNWARCTASSLMCPMLLPLHQTATTKTPQWSTGHQLSFFLLLSHFAITCRNYHFFNCSLAPHFYFVLSARFCNNKYIKSQSTALLGFTVLCQKYEPVFVSCRLASARFCSSSVICLRCSSSIDDLSSSVAK